METLHTDVLVVGGGIAGISAATAIAQEKKKVVLVDRLSAIGGASVNSNVGTMCGAFYRSQTERKIAGNSFSKFFLNILERSPGFSKPYHHQDGLYIIPYEWTALQNIYSQLLLENEVDVQLNSNVNKILVKNNRIEGVTINENKVIRTNSIIDCSGNAIVSQLTNLETIKHSSYQAASQIFRVKNISETNEYTLNIALKKIVLQFESEKKWPTSHRSLSVVQGSIRNNSVDLKLTIPEVITDNTSFESLTKIATSAISSLMDVLKSEIKSLHHAKVETIFPLPGYRVMQRSKGKYVLTEEDVLHCKKSNQGITVGTWPIEEWGYDGKLNMQYFAEDDGYHIPAGCLISDQIENLFFGGRNISATSKAMASARVMGTCWQTGYVAGKLSCTENQTEIQKTIEAIRGELQ